MTIKGYVETVRADDARKTAEVCGSIIRQDQLLNETSIWAGDNTGFVYENTYLPGTPIDD